VARISAHLHYVGRHRVGILYWNQQNFEGLATIAGQAMGRPHLKEFGVYCQLRSSGLRKKALNSLRTFLSAARSLTFDERKEIVCWLLETQLRAPNVHQLLPQPLIAELIEPTLSEWVLSFPGDGAAHRWCGYISHDANALQKAIAIDETDSVARWLLIAQVMKNVDFATHHLVESLFVGREADVLTDLGELAHHLAMLPQGSLREGLESRFRDQRQLVDDWIEYKAAPQGSFPEWCVQNGRMYQWPSIVYYSK